MKKAGLILLIAVSLFKGYYYSCVSTQDQKTAEGNDPRDKVRSTKEFKELKSLIEGILREAEDIFKRPRDDEALSKITKRLNEISQKEKFAVYVFADCLEEAKTPNVKLICLYRLKNYVTAQMKEVPNREPWLIKTVTPFVLNDKEDTRVRGCAAECLAEFRDKTIVQILLKVLQEPGILENDNPDSYWILSDFSKALQALGSSEAIPLYLEKWKRWKTNPDASWLCAYKLRRMTAHNFGEDYDAWVKWWSENKNKDRLEWLHKAFKDTEDKVWVEYYLEELGYAADTRSIEPIKKCMIEREITNAGANALYWIGRTPEVIQALFDVAKDAEKIEPPAAGGNFRVIGYAAKLLGNPLSYDLEILLGDKLFQNREPIDFWELDSELREKRKELQDWWQEHKNKLEWDNTHHVFKIKQGR